MKEEMRSVVLKEMIGENGGKLKDKEGKEEYIDN